MKFHPGKCDEFLNLFNENHSKIAGFKNCEGVELLRDVSDPTIFFTYSKWKNEEALNHYRSSELFKEVWSKTKVLFASPAEAWSTTRLK